MHNINQIRANPELYDRQWQRRGLWPQTAELLESDERRRQLIAEAEGLQAKRNRLSAEIGKKKLTLSFLLGADRAVEDLMAEVAGVKEELVGKEQEVREAEEKLISALGVLPNLPAAGVPAGADEADNVEIRRWGQPAAYDFTPQTHEVLATKFGVSGGMDFEAGVALAGSRFTVLKGGVARLHRALAQFMLNLHTEEFGYTEVDVPLLVKSPTLYGTGQLPKFAEDMFQTADDRWLIPTAEAPLTTLVMDKILQEAELPLRFTAGSYCFRSEIGAAGRDTTGMIRQHQFFKVELVSVTRPEDSEAEHERMTACAEEVLKRLELPYRVMLLCAGDMGFSAQKTYDLEVWLPGQGRYREISSCSNCGDFQARRMRARYRPTTTDKAKPALVHTLNGSGLAVGRALIAVLENYQQADGSVRIPEVLVPYMGGLQVLR
jgi:seryl-tRNA synthetase